jgi:hypothetical protein
VSCAVSKGQQEDYVRLVPTRSKGVLADTISEVYKNMSAQSAGEKHMIIHQELKLGTEQQRKCSFDFFSIPEEYQEIVKTLRRTSQVMYEATLLALTFTLSLTHAHAHARNSTLNLESCATTCHLSSFSWKICREKSWVTCSTLKPFFA